MLKGGFLLEKENYRSQVLDGPVDREAFAFDHHGEQIAAAKVESLILVVAFSMMIRYRRFVFMGGSVTMRMGDQSYQK